MLGCGCNPGMVSVWAQVAIDKINEHYKNKTHKNAEELGVRTVHISEVDTQRTKNPKHIDEYCNTWGSTMEPLYEEALAPLEMSFGSHEDMPLANVVKFDEENRVLVMDRIAMNTLAQSYTPLYGNFIGMMIRHEENVTIGEKLSTYKKQDGKKVKTWAPTVHYVYKPCNETLGSLAELKDKNYNYQTNYRLLVDDIIDGRDELGLSFFLENGDIFWIGSLLDIDEARNVYMNEFSRYMNATTVQVVGGYLSGIMFTMDKHMKGEHGVYVPDDMDYKKVFEMMKPFYGEFRFEKLEKDDWDCDNFNKNNSFSKMKEKYKIKCEWKLKDFLIDPEKVLGLSRCNFFKFNETVDKCFSI
jgi:homospermidine synthase